MAKILLTWELGAGMGHLLTLEPIARGLADRGHEIVLALRKLNGTRRVFGDLPAQVLSAPYSMGDGPTYRPTHTMALVLHNVGYFSGDVLYGLLRGWIGLFELVEPDLLICDHSPTALLAARGTSIPRINVGNGFQCPPDTATLPVITTASDITVEQATQLQAIEDEVVANINHAARLLGCPEVTRLLDIYYPIDRTILTTHPELDHYASRENASYFGRHISFPCERTEWPAGDGPRLFAYLHRTEQSVEIVKQLIVLGWPAIVHHSAPSEEMLRSAEGSSVRIVNRLVDLQQMGQEADVAVTHAAFGTTTSLLLSGCPVLMAPMQLEQGLFASAVERLGAGLTVRKDGLERVTECLRELVENPQFRQTALRFKAKYQDQDAGEQLEKILDVCEAAIR